MRSEAEKIPEPFRRDGCHGWYLYNDDSWWDPNRDNYTSIGYTKERKEKNEDEEFDELLEDVRKWGETKEVATSKNFPRPLKTYSLQDLSRISCMGMHSSSNILQDLA